MSRRWRYPRSRRGSFYGVPSAAAPTPASYIPVFTEPAGRNSRLAAAQIRRTRFLTVPRLAGPPVGPVRRGRPWNAVARRGEFFTVPLVGAAPAAAPWGPPMLDTRRSPARLVRRGEFFVVPLVGVAPSAPAVVPQTVRPRVRVLFSRRGRFQVPPLPQQVVQASSWVPPITRARRTAPGPARRGEYLSVPSARASCPARITSRRTSPPLCRRGRTWRPPWTFIAPAGPGPYIPKLITSPHRPPVRPARRGVFIEPAWPSVAQSRTTPRPNGGITGRPSTGTTNRPNTGTTERPYVMT